jgi:hypothetical protein
LLTRIGEFPAGFLGESRRVKSKKDGKFSTSKPIAVRKSSTPDGIAVDQ